MKYVIETKKLTKRYENFTLDNINLQVPGGTIMGLIGENGAGKSTTIKAILGLIPCEGECTLLGRSAIEDDVREEVGVALDESKFHDVLSAREVGKMLSRIYKKWDMNVYYQYLQQFQLPEKKKLKEFSRGMKMKLSIAAALSHQPKVLILDEATSGLDPVVRNEILDVFTAFVSDEEHGILISSHITSDLERVADYVTYIHQGAIFLSGEKDEILNHYGKLLCSAQELQSIPTNELAGVRQGKFGCEALVKHRAEFEQKHPGMLIEPVSLEEIMVFLAKEASI